MTKIPDEIIINKIIVLREVKVMIDKDFQYLDELLDKGEKPKPRTQIEYKSSK